MMFRKFNNNIFSDGFEGLESIARELGINVKEGVHKLQKELDSRVIIDTSDHNSIATINLPGVGKKNIDVEIQEDRLIVISVKIGTDVKYYRVRAHINTNMDDIESSYIDGVLSITMPFKKVTEKTVRKVVIK